MLKIQGITAAAALLVIFAGRSSAAEIDAAKVLSEEWPIDAIQAAMTRGELSSEALVRAAMAAISARNGELHAVIAVNEDSIALARQIDKDRKAGKALGPLAGIPVLIKDNVETRDAMPTTAGSLALKGNVTRRDSPSIAKLRAAGAVILGKTNLSEWANIRSNFSVSGWSAVGGLTANPHDPARNACGSSSGSGAALAADFAVLAVGTETDGSVVCPSSMNGIVGLKPTVGLLSRTYVVPISHSQDTPGPMGHHVKDVAQMLTIMAGSDRLDPATIEADKHKTNYAAGLDVDDLKDLRLGVLRDEVGRQPKTVAAFEAALASLRKAGAILVDIADSHVEGLDDAEHLVLMTELKADLNAYFAGLPIRSTVRSLEELIAFDRGHAAEEMPFFGQDLFEEAEDTKGLKDPAYLAAKAKSGDESRKRIDGLLKDNDVKILIAPTMGPAWLSDTINGDQYTGASDSQLPATAGYPHLTVPMGKIQGLPVGLSFIGTKWSEAELLKAGYAFEQVFSAGQ